MKAFACISRRASRFCLRATYPISKHFGSPAKPQLDLSGDWAEQLQRTISPRMQGCRSVSRLGKWCPDHRWCSGSRPAPRYDEESERRTISPRKQNRDALREMQANAFVDRNLVNDESPTTLPKCFEIG
jgi:nuclear pore complex protein Nup98-Nup96